MRQYDTKYSEKRAEEGQNRFQQWRDNLLSTPEGRETYEEEGEKLDKWLASEEHEAKATQPGSHTRAAVIGSRGFTQSPKGLHAKKEDK